MRSAIFNEALMATARVACCAALVGCIGPDEAEDSSVADSNEPVDSRVEDSSDPLAECQEHVADLFASGDVPTTETEECCQMIAEDYDLAELEGLENWAERDDCCELLEWGGSMACTPWGPPCPPKMAAA